MKRLITASAILFALSTSAFAMASPGLSSSDAFDAQRRVPGADLAGLTSAQAGAISGVLHGGDENIGAQIRSILMWN